MKLKQLVITASAVLSISLSSSVLANTGEATSKLTNAWTDCGIGAMIFKDMKVPAAISNVIWDLGTTAVISMAASPDTCKGVNVASAVFINESLDSIEADLAKGEGAHAIAMLALMGCDVQNHSKVLTAIRNEVSVDSKFSELAHTEKAQALYLKASQQVKACSIS